MPVNLKAQLKLKLFKEKNRSTKTLEETMNRPKIMEEVENSNT